jgi:hypothetical protein
MNNNSIYSTMIRAGRTTYFVDIRQAKNGKNYLSISQQSIDADEKKQRAVIRVFAESVESFKEAINEAVTAAQQ